MKRIYRSIAIGAAGLTWLAAVACANNGGTSAGIAQVSTSEPSQQSTATLDLAEALRLALLDEYKAEATYRSVMNQFGEQRPFSNIIEAERRHAQALLVQHEAHDLTPIQNPWATATDDLPTFNSLSEACAASVKAERDNIELYDRLLSADVPKDFRSLFIKLQDASRSRHLPAFQRCVNRR